MAVLDPHNDTVVIRVVYDGPPMAGKTTSVKMLAEGLGGQVVVPEEIAGRTLFFDWLDYTGGLFEGRQIRCQIVSVPGQATLASRRRRLLESADVVVFVGDSTAEAQASVGRYLEGLRSVLSGVADPPIGIVLQANKRDDASAVPIEQMRQALGTADLKVAIVESVATEGTGVREAFVFAVRLALDRVREMMRVDRLPVKRPEIDSADDLLSELKRNEGSALELAADSGLVHTRLSDLQSRSVAAAAFLEVLKGEAAEPGPAVDTSVPSRIRRVQPVDEQPPEAPRGALASGMIWPPVNGRLLLHEVMASDVPVMRNFNGDWMGVVGDAWDIQSPATARFTSLDEGRLALVSWARVHAANARVLSDRRCIALAPDGAGSFRLWQFVGIEKSLRDQFEIALNLGPAAIATALLQLVERMLDAARHWSEAACRLPLSLRKVGTTAGSPRYLGRMPFPVPHRPVESRSRMTTMNALGMELTFARSVLSLHRGEILAAMEGMTHIDVNGDAEDPAALAHRFISAL